MGRHRGPTRPRQPLLGWGLFATCVSCVLLAWRDVDTGVVLTLGGLGVTLSAVLWWLQARFDGS